MRKYLVNNTYKLLILLVVVYSSLHCTKVNHQLGENIIPDKDKLIIVLDTISNFEFFTKEVDSFRVDEFEHSYIGSYVSPRLGRINTVYTTELMANISKSSFEFTDDYVVDTVVLKLAVGSPIGNINSTMRISMYELKKNFRKPYNAVQRQHAPEGYFDPYYSNFDYKEYLKDTAYVTFDIDVAKVASTGEIEIPLSKEIGERIVKLKLAQYEQDSSFRKEFMGFCFVVEPAYAGGAILKLNPNTSQLNINVYDNKKWEEEDEKDIISIEISFGHISNSELYNQMVTTIEVDRSFANSQLGIPEEAIDSLISHDFAYVSGMGNVITRIKFPVDEINALKDKLDKDSPSAAIIVTNATLVLPTYNYYDIDNANMGALNNSIFELAAYYNFSIPTYMPDYTPDYYGPITNSGLGGMLNRSFNKYEMNITAYIQEVLNDKTEHISIDIPPSQNFMMRDQLTKLFNSDTDGNITLKLTYCVAE